MDTLTIIDTLRIIDSVKYIDTLFVNIAEDKNSVVYILKSFSPYSGIIGAIIGAFLGYYFTLKKERRIDSEKEFKKFNQLKSHIIHSCNNLIKATEHQLMNTNEMLIGFTSPEIEIKKVTLDSSFDVDNFIAIQRIDYYTLFIEKSIQSEFKKAEAFNHLNFSLKVTKNISENLILDFKKYNERIFQLKSDYNKISSEIRNILNWHIKSKTIPEFTSEISNFDFKEAEQSEDIYYLSEVFYKPLLKIAKRNHILELINTIPEVPLIIKHINATKEQYKNIFTTYIDQMHLSIAELKDVIAFLEQK